MVQVAGGEVSGEANGVGYAAPGFEADEGAAGFMRGPEAVGLGLVAAHGEVGLFVFVQKHYALYLAMFQHEGIDGEGIACNGQEAVFIYWHVYGGRQFCEEAAVQAVRKHGLLNQVTVAVETL